MTLPVPTVSLHGKYLEPNLAGTPRQGTVTFTPTPAPIAFLDQNFFLIGTETATLDSNGEFTIVLAATDTANQNPTGWTYTVTEKILGERPRSYQIFLPYTTALMELADITPTDTAPTYLPVIGPPGVVQVINGYSAAIVNLTASDVGAIPTGSLGTAGGIATLDGTAHLTASQLPTNVVTLGTGDTRYVLQTSVGAASGVASLDSGTKVPVAQIPDISATYVLNTRIGAASGVASLDSGTKIPVAQIPSLPASQTTSGTFATARIPDLSATYIAVTQKAAASGVASLDASTLVPVAQIPNLDAAKITTGTLGTARIPDLSATYIATTQKAAASGVASLDATTRLPVAQLPTSAITQTSGDARYQLLTLAAREDLGYYVPPGWGAFWKPKRAAAGSAQAVVAIVGSSSAQGLYAANLLTTSFVGKLITNLQTTYGDGGSGFFHTARSLTFMGAGTVTNAWNALSGNFCQVNNLANWSVGNPYGPGANYIYTQTVGDTITFIVRGTKARVYTLSGAGRSNWSYTVDGGSSTAVTDSGTGGSTIQVTNINGLSSGSHTLVLTKAGSAGTSFAVCGVTGENAAGVVVNNFGMSGAKSGDFTGFTNNYDAGRWSGGPDYPADLVIYMLGANDANIGYTGDTWAANLEQFLQGVRDGQTVGAVNATGNTDILIVMQHIGKYDSNYKWQDYCARVRGIAEAYGAAVVNLWAQGRNSWNYLNSLSYWGNGSTAGGVAGTDTIHMSDAGHTFMYNGIQPVVTAA